MYIIVIMFSQYIQLSVLLVYLNAFAPLGYALGGLEHARAQVALINNLEPVQRENVKSQRIAYSKKPLILSDARRFVIVG